MRKLIAWIGILAFITFSGSAVYGKEISKEASIEVHDGMDFYRAIQDAVNAGISKDQKSSEILELKFQLQADKIEKLEREIEWLKGKPESNTASTVLAAASVIITALGVLIAILSILGYSNIKKEAVKTSRDTAKETVSSIAGVELMDATEKNIIVLMENGRFDEIIQNAVASITYRGIDDIASEGDVK